MAKFRFQLDPLLRHRRSAEDRCQRDVAKVLRQRMILQTQVSRLQQNITDSKCRLTGDLVGRVDLDRISQFAHFSGQMTRRAQEIVLRIASIEKQIEEGREKLLTATRARQALELLRDRQFERWRLDQENREAAALDDLATQQFVRQAAGEF